MPLQHTYNCRNCHNCRLLNHTKSTSTNLDKDKVRYYGIVKMIEIIGEAAYKLSNSFIDSHPDVPWKVIRGMRHYLVHEYYQVSKEGLWDTINSDLPQLRPYIIKYIEELS